MFKVFINPDNFHNTYLQCLNKCFNGWGTEADFNWVFNRKAESFLSDIMVLKSESEVLLAGSGLTYRKLVSNLIDKKLDIGIMTGSWTLAEARGKGCFSEIINLSVEISNKKNCNYLTAFVTKSNASYRRLESAGAKLIKSAYLFSDNKKNNLSKNEVNIEIINQLDIVNHIDDLLEKRKIMMADKLSFFYTKESFLNQYINRKGNIQLIKLANEYSVIEETDDKIKIHLLTYSSLEEFQKLMQSIISWALAEKDKGIIYFSTQIPVIEMCKQMNFEEVEGFYTVIQPNNDIKKLTLFDRISIDIQMGDKM